MIVRADPAKAWLRVAGCAVFAAFGLFLALRDDVDVGVRGFGWIVLALFVGMAVMQMRSAMALGDQLSIDDLGVFDRRVTDRYVPWSEIRGVTAMYVKAQPFIYLDVGDDPLRFTESLGKKALLKLNQYHLRGVMIVPHGLTASFAQILAELEARLAAGQAAGTP